ncbi:hypothetical protein ANN_11813, partial [Periplaneta americana]
IRRIFCGPLEKELRKRLVKCFVWSVALYGEGTWTLQRNEEKRIEAFEMWMWRRTVRVKWTDRIRNKIVFEKVYNLVIFYNDEVRSEDSPKDCPAFAFWLGKTSEKPNQITVHVTVESCQPSHSAECAPSIMAVDIGHIRQHICLTWSQATKGNIEGRGFGPVLRIEFGVAQWSERLNIIFNRLLNDAISTTRLFSVDGIGDREMAFGKIRPRIRHRLPDIRLTAGENLGKTQPAVLMLLSSSNDSDDIEFRRIGLRKIFRPRINNTFVSLYEFNERFPMSPALYFRIPLIRRTGMLSLTAPLVLFDRSRLHTDTGVLLLPFSSSSSPLIPYTRSTITHTLTLEQDITLHRYTSYDNDTFKNNLSWLIYRVISRVRRRLQKQPGLVIPDSMYSVGRKEMWKDRQCLADDQLVIAASEDGLQKLIYELQITASNYNLTISPTKTKILAFQGKTQVRCKILINDNIVEQVRDFKYLGCEIGNTRELDQQRKLQNFNQICGTIKRTLLNKTRKETILKFYKVLAVPSLLYGSECWTLTENQKHKIEVSEMRFLRSVAGYRRTDRQYNETIRDELNIFNLNNKIKEYQEKYYEHVQRMPEYRIPKKILEYKPKGKRDRGRPTKRWRDQFL